MIDATEGGARIRGTQTLALAIFHDRNANERLDTNWIGVPKEPYGFSNARTRTFGPPRYRDCVLKLQKDMIIRIPLE